MTYETIITIGCIVAAAVIIRFAFRDMIDVNKNSYAANLRPPCPHEIVARELSETLDIQRAKLCGWRGRALAAEAALARIEATIAACEAEVISC